MCCLLHIFIKIILFIINTIIAIFGLTLIGLGSVLAYYRNSFDQYVGHTLLIGATVVIAVGCIFFLVGFSGCCGALGDVSWLLILYAVFMLIFCGFKIYIVVTIFTNRAEIEQTLIKELDTQFEKPELRETFYIVEFVIGCCGSNGGQSYVSINATIPPTCCPSYDLSQINAVTDIDQIISIINGTDTDICPVEDTHQGCGPLVMKYLLLVVDIVGYFFVVLLVAEGIAVLFVIYLVRRIRSKNKKERNDMLPPSAPRLQGYPIAHPPQQPTNVNLYSYYN